MSALLLAGILVRAMILFATPLLPKINGGYYLVQARCVFERGRLAFDDLPLLFWIQAGLAWVLNLLGVSDSEQAIMLAVKLTDTILPTPAAVAVFALVRRFHQTSDSGTTQPPTSAPLLPAIIAAALSLWHASALAMIGDFQKNSLGMVWLAGLLWSLHRAESLASVRRWGLVVVFFLLGGITHVGALAAIIICLASWIFVRLWTDSSRRRAMTISLLGLLAVTAILLLVFFCFDATRAARLAQTLTSPWRMFENSVIISAFSRGPGGLSPPALANMLAINALAVVALIQMWPRRNDMNHADRTLGGTLILCCLVLASPLINRAWADRLLLMAYLPAAALLGLVLMRMQQRSWRHVLTGIGAVICLGSVLGTIGPGSQPSIPVASIQELRGLSRHIEHPQRTLIVTRHGLEWWAAWFLHTNVAHGSAVDAKDWTKYERVMFLRQTRRDMPPGHPQPQTGRPGNQGPPMPGFPDVPIPTGATILENGSYFQLATTDQPAEGYPLRHPPQ